MDTEQNVAVALEDNYESNASLEEPRILEEVVIEELSIDGICGVY